MLLRDHGQGSGARGDKRELHLRGAQPHAPRAIVVAGHCGQGCAEEEAVGAEGCWKTTSSQHSPHRLLHCNAPRSAMAIVGREQLPLWTL